ncbi:MAG: outer membrane beta-barrel protein [Chlorobium sp.]
MRKTFLILVAFAGTSFTTQSAEAEGKYVSAFAGVSWMPQMHVNNTNTSYDYMDHYSMKPNAALSGAIGYDYGSCRLEGELGSLRNNFKSLVMTGTDENGAPFSDASYACKGNVSIVSFMANGYYDFNPGGNVKLYTTVGVGCARVSFNNVGRASENYGNNINTMSLASQIGAGVTTPITENISIDIRYRYFMTSNMTVNWDYKGKDYNNNTSIKSHSISVGTRISL